MFESRLLTTLIIVAAVAEVAISSLTRDAYRADDHVFFSVACEPMKKVIEDANTPLLQVSIFPAQHAGTGSAIFLFC
jgi:hypothetical protein